MTRGRRSRRLAKSGSRVAITTEGSTKTFEVVSANEAATLSAFTETPVLEFKEWKQAAIANAIAEEDRAVLAAVRREETKASRFGRSGGLLGGHGGRLMGAGGVPVGGKKKTPAQIAAEARASVRNRQGVAARVRLTGKSAEIVETILEPLRAIVKYPRLDSDTRAAIGDYIKSLETLVEQKAVPVPITTQPPALESWDDFMRSQLAKQAPIPVTRTVEELIDAKLAPLASEPIEVVVERDGTMSFEGFAGPRNFEDASVSSLEQAEYIIEKSARDRAPSAGSRKYRVG